MLINKEEKYNISNADKANLVNMKTKTSKKKSSMLNDISRLLFKIVIVLLIFILFFTFIFVANRYGDLSMEPAINDGDMIISYRWDKRYNVGDVCSFIYEGKETCSRVVAKEGDKVDITSKGLLVNGSKVQERKITKETTQVKDGVTFPLVVPEKCVFVLGDNRDCAVDSRIFGCVSVENTEGKVIGVFRHRGI